MNITNAADLRTAYLQTFDGFALSPGDIVESSEGRVNMRYARELLGVLTTAGLLIASTVNDDEEVWQVNRPGTYDDHTRDEAEAEIDLWLSTTNPTEQGSKPSAQKDRTMTKETPDTVHPCYCGCKENVPSKSFYRPGHDARHAGNVGRQAALLDPESTEYSDLLNDLPSDRLVEKAKGIEAKAREKADAKAAREEAKANKPAKGSKTEPAPEEGTIKVGKNEFAATRRPDGTVVYFKGDEEKVASKSAAKTFTVG